MRAGREDGVGGGDVGLFAPVHTNTTEALAGLVELVRIDLVNTGEEGRGRQGLCERDGEGVREDGGEVGTNLSSSRRDWRTWR